MDKSGLLTVDSIFNWVQTFPPSSNEKSNEERFQKRLESFIARHSAILSSGEAPTSLTPQEEENYYAYLYYGPGRFSSGSPSSSVLYTEEWSHQKIATQLLAFAFSVEFSKNPRKYSGGSSSDCEEIQAFLGKCPLEQQALSCQRLIDTITSPNKNPGKISADHLEAYAIILGEICARCELPIPGKAVSSTAAAEVNHHQEQSLNQGDSYQAVLNFLMGYLMEWIEPDAQTTSECYFAATQKEPNNYFWWHLLFLTKREMRAEERDAAIELEYATKAYENAPEKMKVKTGLQMIMAGTEDAKKGELCYWKTENWMSKHSPAYRNALAKMRNHLNCHSKLNGRAKWACLKISEISILSGANEACRDFEKIGKDLLEKCLLRNPNCHLTLGALRALHCYGSPTGLFINKREANDLFSEAKKILESTKVSELFQFSDANPASNTNQGKSSVQRKLKVDRNADDWQKIISTFKLESPLVWVATYSASIPVYVVRNYPSMSHYLIHRLKLIVREFRLQVFDSIDKAPETEQDISTCIESDAISGVTNTEPTLGQDLNDLIVAGSEEWLSTQIAIASLVFYLKKSSLAYQIWNNCQEALKQNPENIKGIHLRAFSYLLESMELLFEFTHLKNKYPNPPAGNTKKGKTSKNSQQKPTRWERKEQFFKKNENAMKQKWESVKSSAVADYVKGRIACLLGTVNDISLKQFRKAIELEADFYFYHQALYEKLKQMRKSGCNLNNPSSDELRACQKAHELSPGNVKILIDLATVKLQNLTGRLKDECFKGHAGYEKKMKEVKVIKTLLSDANALAPPNSRHEMMVKLKTAEMYSTRGLPDRSSEAQKIFLELYEKWPKSSMVLHKLAKYQYGAKARKIYEEALQVGPQNYPCLMDYLKVLGKYLKNYKEIVVKINKHLSFMRHEEHIVNLMIIKGQACWLQKCAKDMKRAACETWIKAFVEFEWIGSKVSKGICSKNSDVFGALDISLAELCPLFKKVCISKQITGNKPIDEFIRELEKAVEHFNRFNSNRSDNLLNVKLL